MIKKQFFEHFTIDLRSGSLVFGADKIDRMFSKRVGSLRAEARHLGDDAPTIVGETGIPFDISGGGGLGDPNDPSTTRALDRTIRAMESNLLSYCLWNYTPDNDHDHGDQWNGENLSIFSGGSGRALRAIARPSVSRVSGKLVESSFDIDSGDYVLRFTEKDAAAGETEIVLPAFAYPAVPRVEVSDGTTQFDSASRRLSYVPDRSGSEHWVRVRPAERPPRIESSQTGSCWSRRWRLLSGGSSGGTGNAATEVRESRP